MLTILGCSSALPTPSRFSTSQVLNVLERFFLIDCGEGTQIQLKRFKIKQTRINHIFISHLHGDHYLGIFGLISSMSLLNRKSPLNIYGPFKLKKLIDAFVDTMEYNLGYDIIFHPLHYNEKELIFEDDKVTVESFPLRHRVPTCGFLFREKERLRIIKKETIEELSIPIKEIQAIKEGGDFTCNSVLYKNKDITKNPSPTRSYAFVSDTIKTPKIVSIVKDVDILYHEATYADDNKKRAKQTGHSTAQQAGEIASKANVKKLIIGHYSNRYKDLNVLLKEAKEEFDNTELAIDGKVFDVPFKIDC
jgi:ribonuclease Z